MAITRTAIVDDDGTGTTGTIYNNAWKTELYDQIDAALASGSGVVQTTTSTGTVNNFALTTGATLLRANNATALTLTGLAAGAAGQRLILRAVGAGAVTLTDQDAGSTAANRVITGLGAALTLPAGGGWAAFVYDDTTARWVVVGTGTSGGTVTLTDGATPALDASLGGASPVFRLAAAGDRTIAVPTNPTPGRKITIQHLASGGARTLALNTGAGGFRFGSDITALTATASGKTDYIGAIYNDTDSKWDIVAVTKGF